ncbi:hypothetical protein [Polaribacter sp. Z022]|uniref:hypothetical protein n=1 Tax=Polaribacter sp. Z022 TaxID=2927125 RepID=UPI00201FEB5E|nr:hypothetical protein [Polaribacter sp. Z022]
MKTNMKSILLVALMFGTLISYANNDTNSTNNKAKKTVKVEFKNVRKGQSLTIKNDKGVSVYNQEIAASGNFSRTFDFSALENGVYTAELNKDFEIIIKEFYVKNGLVTFLNNSNTKLFKPVIRAKENLIYVSKLDFNNKPLNVVIYYNGEAILSDNIKGDDLLKRTYKLSENKKGEYKVYVNSDNRTYSKNFTI